MLKIQKIMQEGAWPIEWLAYWMFYAILLSNAVYVGQKSFQPCAIFYWVTMTTATVDDAEIMLLSSSPIIIRFLWKVVLQTRGLPSILLINDRHKTLTCRKFVLLILTTTLYRFKTICLFLSFNGNWHEDHEDLGDTIICVRLFLEFYFVWAHGSRHSLAINPNFGNEWQTRVLNWWVLVR